jgi:hypothetical protein
MLRGTVGCKGERDQLRAVLIRKAEELIDRAAEQQGNNAIRMQRHLGALPIPYEAVKEGSIVMCLVCTPSNSDLQGRSASSLVACSLQPPFQPDRHEPERFQSPIVASEKTCLGAG